MNDVSNTIPENDINKQIENEETVVDENITQQDNVVAVSEIQENNETFENQNLDSLIANNLDNFTETTTNNTVEQVTTTAEIPKNKQKNNKKWLFHYFTIFKLMKNSIPKINKIIQIIVSQILNKYVDDVDLLHIICNSVEYIEKNTIIAWFRSR